MKKKTEIILNDHSIANIDDLLNVSEGEKFYFSIRRPSPRSEEEYREKYENMFHKEFIDMCIDKVRKESDKFHIIEFKVLKITKSYQKDYSLDMINPTEIYIESITVEET